ncbi:unnamed protein product [Adineta ricciae]|uniref:Uncharacterized protein n=1 Tax=Adineta ricciae TaxID=249248 RepID=A0A814FIV6_ADIRI|nr:unnamed protein product [Adineta ricciae]
MPVFLSSFQIIAMNAKFIIAVLLVAVLCVDFGQSLQCYQHDYCLGGCPTLSSSIVQCASSDSKCWKLSSPLGTKRGCGDTRCMVQLDTGVMGTASVCCSGNLCNSAVEMKTTAMASMLGSIIVFIYKWVIFEKRLLK